MGHPYLASASSRSREWHIAISATRVRMHVIFVDYVECRTDSSHVTHDVYVWAYQASRRMTSVLL